MPQKIGFDRERYIEMQSEHINARRSEIGGKLYLEMGGKLFDDMHASRVLPGFTPDNKIAMLERIKGDLEIIVCLNAKDLERQKVRADLGIPYEEDALRLIDIFRERGFLVENVVMTQLTDDNPIAQAFIDRLERLGIRVARHRIIPGYPTDTRRIVSEEGFGVNEYVETSRDVVVVTAPGPGSGKLATCLSQVYHENLRGNAAGYAKFETFPIWNLPLKHPVNVAYEAATADLRDVNVIDPFHLEACGETTVNYNRDVEAFPLLKRILQKISREESPYRSPTEMGVNRVGFSIVDDELAREAARQEVVRRVLRCRCEYMMGLAERETVERVELIMNELGVQIEDRRVVVPAREAAERAERNQKGNDGIFCGAAIELRDGTIITGCNSPLMHAATSTVLNAIKHLAEIPDRIHLISPNIIEAIGDMKRGMRDGKSISLDLEEALIAVGASTPSNSATTLAIEQLKELKGCDMHMTHIPTPGDEAGLRTLGLNLTSDACFATESLYII